MSNAKLLPIVERFYTFQGEGVHSGRAAFFVRLFGCPLHCPWCDSAGTWHKNYIPKNIARMSPEDIASEAKASGTGVCVITGGEPMIHDLRPLTSLLQWAGMSVHVETSGAIDGDYSGFDWVTLSPKWAKLPVPEAWNHADEIKIIVEHADSIRDWEAAVGHVPCSAQAVWLHPEWSQRENPDVLRAIVHAVKEQPSRYRAGWQVHKNYRADLIDPRAQKELIPLGGNPALGF